MKRYLLALVNAVQELTEVFRFAMEDIHENFEDLETMLYINATTSEEDFEEQLATEYNDGWEDGYQAAVTVLEKNVVVEERPLSLDELNDELRDAYWDADEENDFIYDQMFST